MQKSKVYFTKEITPDSLIKIYEALGVELDGKVGVKVSTGERGAKGYLKAELIAPLVKKLHSTIIERITSREGEKITKYAESLGLGSTDYELIEL